MGGFSKEITVSKILNLFKYCQISQKILQRPIVSDYLGNLYNKEDVLQYLIDKKRGNKVKESNINSLNDIVELKIDLSSEGVLKCLVSDAKIDINNDSNAGLADVMFSYIVPCGCVINSKVLHSLISDDDEEVECPACGNGFDSADIIDINNLDKETRDKLDRRMKKLRENGLYHNLKKVKKRKRDSNGVEGIKKLKV